jgi:hypothetical protein
MGGSEAMDDAATGVGCYLACGWVLGADYRWRIEMSGRGADMLDLEMVGIFSAMLVFWTAVAGLIYLAA